MAVREPEIVDVVVENSPLPQIGTDVKSRLHEAVLKGGDPVRKLADLLHGTWLGHPLHPVLTDVTIGAWVLGAFFDGLSLLTRSHHTRKTADDLTTLGVITSVPTAIAGMADYSTIKQKAAGHGLLHGLLNSTALVLYVLSLRARKNNRRGLGLLLSTTALGVMTGSAWLGGEMVYRLRVGVNHNEPTDKPGNWTRIMSDSDLPEDQSRRVEVDGTAVLLYRHAGSIYAIGAVCAHAGGPLDEGLFYGHCVQCPWHDSVYDVRDGHVVHGPSTYTQPVFDVRVIDNQIEIRAAQNPQPIQNSK